MNTNERRRDPNLSGGVGPQLKAWRAARGMSQLDLSFDAGLSQRQISFIETGRSVPGRDSLLHLADALDIPFRDRNPLFVAAGYAPAYEDAAAGDHDMSAVHNALQRMLKQHEPFPALVLDRYWNVVSRNVGAREFFSLFADLDSRPEPRNLLELVFDPAAFRPHLANWAETAASLLARVRRESVARSIDAKTRQLIETLAAFPDVAMPLVESHADLAAPAPVIPLTFVKDGVSLSLFSLVTTVGTPQTISAQELRLESMFPLDAQAERDYLELLGKPA